MIEVIMAVLLAFLAVFLYATYVAIKFVLENPLEVVFPDRKITEGTREENIQQALSIPQPYIAIESPKVSEVCTQNKTSEDTRKPTKSMISLAGQSNLNLMDYNKASYRGLMKTKPKHYMYFLKVEDYE